jgi:hypothetical protein
MSVSSPASSSRARLARGRQAMEPRAGSLELNSRGEDRARPIRLTSRVVRLRQTLLLRKSEILIVRTTVVGMIAKAEHTIRPALDCSAA